MSFAAILAWPAGMALLLVAPLAWIAWRALDQARARRVATLAGKRAPVIARDLDPRRRVIGRSLFACGLSFAAVALMQPLGGPAARTLEPRGADIVVCLDVSRSMLARDASPNRLEAARRGIRELAEKARGDRLGLVLFAGQARLAAPLTRDAGAFADLVLLADSSSVGKGGSDVGAALGTALDALEGAKGDHEAIILVTDGEDLGRQGPEIAERCRMRHIAVHAVGYGGAAGSKVPVPQGAGEAFLRDRAGNEVVSALDAEGLRRIAEATGGDYVEAASDASPLAALYDRRIKPMTREMFEGRLGAERENLFQWPLVLALLSFLVALAWSDRRRP